MVPFQTHVEVTLVVGTEGQNGSFQVPKDKRLVIEKDLSPHRKK